MSRPSVDGPPQPGWLRVLRAGIGPAWIVIGLASIGVWVWAVAVGDFSWSTASDRFQTWSRLALGVAWLGLGALWIGVARRERRRRERQRADEEADQGVVQRHSNPDQR